MARIPFKIASFAIFFSLAANLSAAVRTSTDTDAVFKQETVVPALWRFVAPFIPRKSAALDRNASQWFLVWARSSQARRRLVHSDIGDAMPTAALKTRRRLILHVGSGHLDELRNAARARDQWSPESLLVGIEPDLRWHAEYREMALNTLNGIEKVFLFDAGIEELPEGLVFHDIRMILPWPADIIFSETNQERPERLAHHLARLAAKSSRLLMVSEQAPKRIDIDKLLRKKGVNVRVYRVPPRAWTTELKQLLASHLIQFNNTMTVITDDPGRWILNYTRFIPAMASSHSSYPNQSGRSA